MGKNEPKFNRFLTCALKLLNLNVNSTNIKLLMAKMWLPEQGLIVKVLQKEKTTGIGCTVYGAWWCCCSDLNTYKIFILLLALFSWLKKNIRPCVQQTLCRLSTANWDHFKRKWARCSIMLKQTHLRQHFWSQTFTNDGMITLKQYCSEFI